MEAAAAAEVPLLAEAPAPSGPGSSKVMAVAMLVRRAASTASAAVLLAAAILLSESLSTSAEEGRWVEPARTSSLPPSLPLTSKDAS